MPKFWRMPKILALCVIACSLVCGRLPATDLQPGASPAREASKEAWVYIGTYTKSAGQGINLCRLDLATGRLSQPEVVAKTTNPSFLAIHPSRPLLYSIAEIDEFGGKKTGAISAYSVSTANGKLTLLNQQPSGGPGPCHLSVDHSGQAVLAANYSGGSVASFPIASDGSLKPPATIDKHHGKSVHPKRQAGPFAHCINADPGNRFALSADLGTDKLMIYRLNAAEGTLAPSEPAFAALPAGSGPRHLAFHPNGRFVYLINELSSTISAFAYDAAKGKLEPMQSITTLPTGFTDENTTAEIQVHPSGKFLYGSNRGHDSIAMFAIDPLTGKLRSQGHVPSQGKMPRSFALDPSGQFLLVANQGSGNIVVFRVDSDSGTLQPTGNSIAVPLPVCVLPIRPIKE